ncbi:hypothetical protein STFE110948_06180 [Streptobacillus felis]|uniref:hypothetical protein n=1 Tax=Streptobacillus felis TaxID=1384509 RepID=UPI00082E7E87|nr:hypothetical protein [Streptobacillus felis]
MGNFEKLEIHPDRGFLYEIRSNNLYNAGTLSAEIGVKSDRLANNLKNSNMLKFEAVNILPRVENNLKKHDFRLSLNNNFDYKVNENLNLMTDLNYKADILSVKENEVEKGLISHYPELDFKLDYKKDNLELKANVYDKVLIDINLETKKSRVNNHLLVDTSLGYKINKIFKFNAMFRDVYLTDSHRKLEDDLGIFNPDNEYERKRFVQSNAMITGAGILAETEVGKFKFKNNLDVRYRFDYLGKETYRPFETEDNSPIVHHVFAWSENSINVKVTDELNLKANLDIYFRNRNDAKYRIIPSENWEEKEYIDKEILPGFETINYALVFTGFGIDYNTNKVKFINDTKLIISPIYVVDKKPEFEELIFRTKNYLDYKINNIVELNAGLDLEYVNHGIATTYVLKRVVLNQGYLEKNRLIDHYKDDYYAMGDFDHQSEFEYWWGTGKYDSVDKTVLITPSLGLTINTFDNRLKIKPSIFATVHIGNMDDKTVVSRYDARGILKFEYVW